MPKPFPLPWLALAAALAVAPAASRADGEFWGVDVSDSTNGGVLAATRGALNFGAGYTDYGDGVSASLSLTRRLPFDFGVQGLTLTAGPALGFGGGDLSEVALGLNLGTSRYIPFDWGAVFLQASGGTNRRNFFLQAQLTLSDPGLTFSVSRGGSLDYDETSVAVSRSLGDGPVSLRAGYRFIAEDIFVGFSVNTF
ncbi:hypothetical protein [Rubellimicrobium roseum]|uniref:Porin family protein n=1 Tax=Rubellimicrobium roseum TaxID=687525 RepID=A0A5C4NDD1_9RHOB|nr:hypothetical protein [Rubellimicrobium roseum]TNC66574.1 hypothetical protein FHG71_16445 [Rubellimicrobium roseum]